MGLEVGTDFTVPTSKPTLAAYSIHCTWTGSARKCCTESHQGSTGKGELQALGTLEKWLFWLSLGTGFTDSGHIEDSLDDRVYKNLPCGEPSSSELTGSSRKGSRTKVDKHSVPRNEDMRSDLQKPPKFWTQYCVGL